MRSLRTIAALLLLSCALAYAQQQILVPTRPVDDNSNAASSTQYVKNQITAPSTFANPSAQVGLTAVNGVATTAMRSDSAPPLSQTIVPTWTGLHTFNSGLTSNSTITVNPAASSLTQAVNTTQSPSGTTASQLNLNLITITDSATVTGGNFSNGLNISQTVNSSSVQGGRQGLLSQVNLNTATNASNTNRNYVGATGVGTASSGDGGTNTGAGALGAVFGMNPVGQALNGATNLLHVTGGEANVGLQNGSSAKLKTGWSIVSLGNDNVHGVSLDAGLGIGAISGSSLLNQGIQFTSQHGSFPVTTAGTMIGADAGTVTNGVDFSALTISGCAFKTPAACLDPAVTTWVAFTPSLVCGNATFTLGTARFKQVGKTTFLQLDFIISTLGTCTNNITFTLPTTPNSTGAISGQNVAGDGAMMSCTIRTASNTTSNCLKHAATNWVASDHPIISGVYENQ